MEILPPDPSGNRSAPDAPRLEPIPPEDSSLLFGPHGLRPGWGILLAVCVFYLLRIFVDVEMFWVLHHLPWALQQLRGGVIHPTIFILWEAGILLAVLIVTLVMARLEGRRTADYGLAGVDRARQFFVGLASGFGFLSLLVGILLATHHLTLTASHMPLRQTLGYAAVWGLAFLLVGLTEELMFRGYLLFTLARGISYWPAACVLAALFGLRHGSNPGESPVGLLAVVMVALVFSLSLWRLGHLWWAIGFHAAWDWAESFFYGTADSGGVSAGRLMHAHPLGSALLSGGATGPEGSVWVTLVLLLVAVFIWKTQPNRGISLH